MVVVYKVNEMGHLQTKCPHGMKCLVGGGECICCEHFSRKNITSKYIICEYKLHTKKKKNYG
jgi:hypothetical protein